MKNFLELLDTNKSINVELELDVISDNGFPTIEVHLNNQRIFDKGLITTFQSFCIGVNLLDPIKLQIEVSNKEYNATLETAVIIKKFSIDKIDIIPNYTHYSYYDNDHNFTNTTSYLGFNGIWIFDTKAPFYQWLHQAQGQGWLLSP